MCYKIHLYRGEFFIRQIIRDLRRLLVIEWLEVSATTLWRWEKCGYLIPVAVGNKKKYRMSDIQKILQQ